jgi:AAHS family 4-hydroxybenzoate transporter-like MFS transporter
LASAPRCQTPSRSWLNTPPLAGALFVTLVYSGFTIGATGAGLVASWLIPFAGWRVALGSSGVLPMLLSVVLAFALPESVLYLAAKGRNPELTRRLLRKVDPTVDLPISCTFSIAQPVKATENPIRVILSKNYPLTSVSLWVAYFMGVFVVYCLFNWMPLMAREAGFDVSQSAIITSMFTLSGPVGSILIGSAMDRVKPAIVLVAGFLVAAFLLWSMSQRPDSYLLLCLLSFVLGFFAHGSVTGLNALAAKAYPTTASATGVSWMQGWGRTGGIASAFPGGLMLSSGWGLTTVPVALGLPLVAASLALLTLGLSRSFSSRALGRITQRPVRIGQTTF